MPTPEFRCPNSIPCLGVDSQDGDYPIRNFSAEAPDNALFYCTVYTSPPPPLGVPCGSFTSLAVAASVVSQADACELANLIADANACPPVSGGGGAVIDDLCEGVLCAGPNTCKNGICVPVDQGCPETPCPNNEQCVQGECAPNQPTNDFAPVGTNPRLAGSPVVIGDLTPAKACLDTTYSGAVPVRGFRPFLFSADASLPAGLALNSRTGAITGVPTVPGSFNFTVTVQSADGGMATKMLTLNVVEIVNSSPLADATALQAYSETLTQIAGTPPISWQLANGTVLPPGLSLDETTGIISGTPPALVGGLPNDGGTFNFTISMQDEAT